MQWHSLHLCHRSGGHVTKPPSSTCVDGCLYDFNSCTHSHLLTPVMGTTSMQFVYMWQHQRRSATRSVSECEEASLINSLPLCCIFVWLESLMLIISPASLVQLLQTKPVRVNWFMPTQAVCSETQTVSAIQLAGVISENMHHDNLSQIKFSAETE